MLRALKFKMCNIEGDIAQQYDVSANPRIALLTLTD